MALRTLSYDDWLAERLADDPAFARSYDAAWIAARGPARKVHLVLDENLESDLVSEIEAVGQFKVSRPLAGSEDQRIWQQARRREQIIVTADGSDFGSDRKFPVQASPGVIILSGRTAELKLEAFARALTAWDFREYARRFGGTGMEAMKVTASSQSARVRFADERLACIVVYES